MTTVRYSVQNPPDGGWGWVIVLAAFLTFFLTSGSLIALSIMFVAWIEEFDAGRGLTSWVLSVSVNIMFCMGTVSAQLSSRFGYQAVMFIGGLLSSAGFVLSSFATSVLMLIFTMGVIGGVGCGFCFLPAVVVVSLYFDQRRSLAMGVAAAGAGIGSLVGAQALHYLIEEYGWRGAMLIAGGMQLHIVIFALLMRPLPNENDDAIIDEVEYDDFELEEVEEVDEDYEEEDEEEETSGRTKSKLHVIDESEMNNNLEEEEEEEDSQKFREDEGGGEVDIDEALLGRSWVGSEAGEHRRITELRARSNSTRSYTPPPSRKPFANPPHPVISANLRMPLSMSPQHRRVLATEGKRPTASLQHLAQTPAAGTRKFASAHDLDPRRRKQSISYSIGSRASSIKNSRNLDIMSAASMHTLLLINNKVLSHEDIFSHLSLHLDTISGCASERNVQSLRPEQERISIFSSCLASLRSYTYLMKHPPYLVFLLSNILTNLSYFMPSLFMVDRAIFAGISVDTAAILVSLNGAGNLFGRFFLGIVADTHCMQRISWYNLVVGLSGVATCISPLCGDNSILHGLYAFTFGFLIGAYATLAPCVTIDLVGVEAVGQAYGLALLFMGVAGLIGSPLAGWIFDMTGNYTTSFVVHGFFLFLSGIVLVPVAIYLGKPPKQPDV